MLEEERVWEPVATGVNDVEAVWEGEDVSDGVKEVEDVSDGVKEMEAVWDAVSVGDILGKDVKDILPVWEALRDGEWLVEGETVRETVDEELGSKTIS